MHTHKVKSINYSLYLKNNGRDRVYLLVYVYDLTTATDSSVVDDLKNTLQINFKLKDLDFFFYLLCLEVMRSTPGMVVNQRKYAIKLIHDTGLGIAQPTHTPMD